ncbi:MAG: SUMF1/EgtB/PvdO family nonheme iron enzyme, partial [Opitutae bacterium]|nr:SUMF1/EgtB/PvdO family nonheme iron enzyme [Opitutae bacterium]
GTGDTDNALFTIAGDELQLASPLNFEAGEEYSIRVKGTDSGGFSIEKVFTIHVTDVNEAPTSITLDNDTVAENEEAGTVVGRLTGTDPEGDKLTFALAEDDDTVDNEKFSLKSPTLSTAEVLDADTEPTLTVRLVATDPDGLTFEQDVTISVTNVNEAPTDITLAPSTVGENLPTGTEVGMLTTVDPDSDAVVVQPTLPDSLNEGLVAYYPFNGNANDESGNGHDSDGELKGEILTVDRFNEPNRAVKFQDQGDYVLIQNGNSVINNSGFTISLWVKGDFLGHENYFIMHQSNGIDWKPKWALIFSGKDTTGTPGPKFHSSNGPGDTSIEPQWLFGNSESKIFNSSKWTNIIYSYDGENLTLFEDGKQTMEVKVSSLVSDSINAPILIGANELGDFSFEGSVDDIRIYDHSLSGEEISTLCAAEAPPQNEPHTYKLVSGTGDTDNSSFTIDPASGAISTEGSFDFESKSQYSIRVESKDAGGNKFTKAISITVTDGQDAPTAITTDPESGTIREGLAVGTLVTSLSTIDPDSGDTFEYSLVSGTGDTNNSLFRISGNQLQTNTVLSQVQNPTASVRVRSTDAGGNTVEREVAVTVLDQNDTPTDIALTSNSVGENQPFGTAVGSLTATDPDVGDSHSFAFVAGSGDSGNASFFIQNGNELVTNDFLDFESKNSYSIRVQVTDASGATFAKALTVNVSNEEPEPVRYRLTVNRLPEEGGLTPGAGLYAEDATVDVTVTPDPNYTFSGWTGDLPAGANSGDLTLSMTMDSDKTLNAHFARTYHEVEVLVSPDRHGYAHGGGSVLHGTEITLVAEELAAPDTVPFSHWSLNGVEQEVDEANPKTLVLTVEEGLKVEAVFDYGLPESMKHVPAGEFTMGDSGSRAKEQKPAHQVDVSAYYIDSYETSKALWYQVHNWAIQNGYSFSYSTSEANGRNRPHSDSGYKDDFPITGISWHDMVKWTNARSEMEGFAPVYFTDTAQKEVYRTDPKQNGSGADFTGFLITEAHVDWRAKGYRLPTEAEWEKAARGGANGLLYPHGDSIANTDAFYDQETDVRSLASVGGYTANSYGLHDMSGNAWEACWDWNWNNWYAQPEASLADPKGPARDRIGTDNWAVRMARGGSGNSDKYQTQVAYRKDFNKTWFQYAITVRPVVSAPSEPDATLTIKVNPSHLGSVVGGGVYKIGDSASLSFDLESNATFGGWEDTEGNQLSKAHAYSHVLTGDTTVIAILNENGGQNYHTVETIIKPFGNGTISGGGAYLAGSVVTLTATPNEGTDFAGWSGDVSGTSASTTLVVNGDKSVIAYFGDTSLDSDEDGLSDLYEQSLGSDPYNSDTDGDGLKDGDEANIHGSSPVLTDTDGDGFDDKAEVTGKTDPNDPNDFPFMATKDLARYFMFKNQATDNSPNKTNGKANSVSEDRDRNGIGKSAFKFNGTKSYIEATGFKGGQGASARTVSGWVRVGLESDMLPGVFNGMESEYNSGINDMESDYSSSLNDLESTYGLSLNSMDSDYTTILNELQSALSSRLNQLESSGNDALTLKSELSQFLDNQETELDTRLAQEQTSFNSLTEDSSAQSSFGNLAEQQKSDFSALALQVQTLWTASGSTESTGGLVTWGKSGNIFEVNLNAGVLQVVADGNTIEGSTSLVDDNWHQFIVILPENGALDDASIHLDGVSETLTQTGSTSATVSTELDKDVLVGNGPAGFFNGWLDDIRIYERSLGASESLKLFKLEEATGELVPEENKPVISTHPSHQNTATGGDATFTVQASGQPSPTYTWQKQDNRKWKDIAGGTSSTLTISGTTLADATNYRVVVANNAGEVNSKTARLVVLDPPVITIQPTDMLFASGSNARIELAATGSKTLRFKWFKDGKEIPKATKNKVTLKKVTASKDNGTYQVEVENGAGKVTSDEFQVSVIGSVEVTADPEDAAFVQGQPGSLSITATGDGTLAYQWEKFDPKSRKWSIVEGATSPTLSIADVQPELLADYRCMVDNGASREYSKGGELGMYIVPTFKTQPRSYSINEGRKVSLKTVANGDPTPTYQWEKLNGDGVTWEAIPKATKGELKFSKIKTENAGKYRVKAINGGGTATSDEADLVVYYAPIISADPLAASVNEGTAINLSVTVDSLDSKGTTSTYTWYNGKKAVKDGDGISGANTANLSITSAAAENAGSYYCSIKNGVGTVKTRSAKITVILKPYSTKALKNLDLADGKTATFSASIQGAKPITYQWQQDGVDIPGQTKNKLSLRGVKAAQSGTYSIIATNAAGSLTLSAELTVAAAAVAASAEEKIVVEGESLLSAVEDADNDGMSNLLEHALGSDPANNGSTFSPIVDTVEDGSGQTYVSFSYSENKSATGVTYTVERSDDLKTWEPVDLSSASVNRLDRDSFTEVTIFIPATEGSGFFRVRVE